MAFRFLALLALAVVLAALLVGARASRGNAAALVTAQLVKDINPGGDSSLQMPLVFEGKLYFQADDGSHGQELWKSDGSETGTSMVKDINPVGDGYLPGNVAAYGGSFYFAASDGSAHGRELWKSDGTASGTVMVKDINPGSDDSYPDGFAVFNGSLFFSADDGTHGVELWKTDGTAGGTVVVTETIGDPWGFTVFDGSLYFAGDNGSDGVELWKSDGTDAGTVMVKDINTAGDSEPYGFTPFNGKLYFSANDGSSGGSACELWKTDGSAAGTVLVKYISNYYDGPGWLTVFDGSLYFSADDEAGGHGDYELWKTDGTTDGTKMVKDINPSGSSSPRYLTVFGGNLFFSAGDGTGGMQLWKTNGTTTGTVMVKNTNPGADGNLYDLTIFGGALYFAADDGVHGYELWRSDGSTAGTSMAADINPADSGGAGNLTVVGSTLYFSADDGTHGDELWKYGDFSPPETQLTSGPSGLTGDATPTFAFSMDEPGSFQCSLDSGGYSACTSPAKLARLADGSHTFRVQALDRSGNIDASPAARTFTIDTISPETSIASGPGTRIGKRTAGFSFSSSEPGSSFICQFDGSAWTSCSSPKTYSALTDRKHSFAVRAIDQAGNSDLTPASRASYVDTRPPQTKIVKHPKKLVRTKTAKVKIRFTFKSSEAGSRFACKLDKGKWASCGSVKTYKAKPGKHVLQVRARDATGNTDRSPARWAWAVKRA
ncbi:MAG: ELWxxDGT repeat protein [Gaiellaceae bacterium]